MERLGCELGIEQRVVDVQAKQMGEATAVSAVAQRLRQRLREPDGDDG
jgi:hypothetical protein